MKLFLLLLVGTVAAQAQQPTGMLSAYAANRDQGIGNYVTHDAILLGQELCLEEAVTEAEQALYTQQVQTVLQELGASAQKAVNSPITTANRQFLAVLNALLSGKDAEAGPVKEEVDKIHAAQGMSASAIFPETIDYTQFRIRGHYTRSPELGRYFQTVRFAGTILFAVKDSNSTGIDAKQADLLTEQAMQLADWISDQPKALAAYKEFNYQTGLFFGEPDDLILSDLQAVRNLKGTPAQRAALLEKAKKNGRQPQILGGLIDIGKLENGVSASDALTGWRLFPQRRSPDGAAFQQIIFSNVGVYQGTKQPASMDVVNGQKVKVFPLAMELPALLGSSTAASALDKTDERNYQGYSQAFAKAHALLSESTRPGTWLPVMQQLIAVKTDTPESSQQLLTTAMAYWTRNRHRSLLYEKQSYTPVAKGMQIAAARNAAYLEPSTAVYQALLAQVRALTPAMKAETAAAMTQVLEKCVAISTKETAGADLTAADMTFLNEIDAKFLLLAHSEDNPVVVDVHTNPSSQQVLEEGIGCPRYVDFKMPKTGTALRGARFTHIEFRQPMNERMTDEEWKIRAQAAK